MVYSIYNNLKFSFLFTYLIASLLAQLVMNPPAMQDTQVQFLGWEYPLEKGKATHSSILAYIVLGVAKSQTQLSDFHFTKQSPKKYNWHIN